MLLMLIQIYLLSDFEFCIVFNFPSIFSFVSKRPYSSTMSNGWYKLIYPFNKKYFEKITLVEFLIEDATDLFGALFYFLYFE